MIAQLKSFRYPRVWSGLWILAVIIVVAVSLGPPPPLSDLPSGIDKLEHALAYAALAFGAVQIFRDRAMCLLAGIALVGVGIGVEFAQGALTVDRMRDPWDAVANTVGVLLGLATWMTPARDWWLRVERRMVR